jgi:hypothetical protein
MSTINIAVDKAKRHQHVPTCDEEEAPELLNEDNTAISSSISSLAIELGAEAPRREICLTLACCDIRSVVAKTPGCAELNWRCVK